MKKVIAMAAALMLAAALTGCGNGKPLDTVYTFGRAIVSLPDGTVVDGNVDTWTVYKGDQLQVTIEGVTYIVHSSNIALIAGEEDMNG